MIQIQPFLLGRFRPERVPPILLSLVGLVLLSMPARGAEPEPGSPGFFRQPPSALSQKAGTVFGMTLPAPVPGDATTVSEAFRTMYPPPDFIHHPLADAAFLILPRSLHDAQGTLPPRTPMQVFGEWIPADPLDPTVFALVVWEYKPVRVPAPLSAPPYPDGYRTTLSADSPIPPFPQTPLVRLQTTLGQQDAIPPAEASAMGFGEGAWFRLQGSPSPVLLVYSDRTQGLAEAVHARRNRDPVTVYGRLFLLVHPEKPARAALLVDGILDMQTLSGRPDPAQYPYRNTRIVRELIALPMIRNVEIDYVYRGHTVASPEQIAHFPDLKGKHIRLDGAADNFLGDRIELFVPTASGTLVAELELAQPGDSLLLRCRRIEGADLRHALLIEDVQRAPVTPARSP